MIRLFLASISILSLTACTVGPNYKPPKTSVPAAFAGYTDLTAAKNAHPENLFAQWWTTLQDPLLNSLIDRAVRGNLDLQLAQARVREARARRGVSKADLFPNVIASGSYQRNRTSKNIRQANAQPSNRVGGNLFQAGFDAAWEIDIFGKIRREVEAANAEIGAEIENQKAVLVSLLAEVARNYIDLRGFQQQIAIARGNLRAQQDTLELTRIRFRAGLVSDLDVARAEAQVETTASQIPLLETAKAQTIHLLSVLLGLEPNALQRDLHLEKPIPSSPLQVPEALPSEMLRRRPDVLKSERQLAAATARIGVATADLFPRFSLTAFFGLGSSKFSNLNDSGSRFWSIIPGVSLPVFNFGKIRNNIKVENAREEQAFIIYEQTVLTSLKEVEDALVALSQDQTRRQNLSNAVDANRHAVEMANELYKKGLTDFLSVLDAQRNLFASEDALVEGDRNVTLDFVALYKALGGGWEIDAVTESPTGKAGDRVVDLVSQKQ